MKNCFWALFLFLCAAQISGHHVYAQSADTCREIVKITVDAINSQSTDSLKKHLAPDFVCANQTGKMAVTVMDMLIKQLNEHVSEISFISEQRENGRLLLVYDFYYKKLGRRKTTFVFDAENRLAQLELIAVQVKKVGTKTDFERPEREVITLPVEICNNLMIVTAELNGEKRPFILDSGAPTLYLNSACFDSGDTDVTVSSAVQGATSAVGSMNAIHIDSFDLCGIQAHDKEFVMSDLSHLVKDREIYGLIGFQVIKDYDWLFDYENRTFTLIKPDKTAEYLREKGYRADEVPLYRASKTSHIPYVNGMVDGVVLSLGIDCGATGNLFDITLWECLENQLKDKSTGQLRGASGDAETVREATVKSLKIGDRKFKNLPTAFNDMTALQRNWQAQIKGLIGYEILSKQPTVISLHSDKLFFLE